MSDASATPNPYQCPKCWAPIPSNRSQANCPSCYSMLSQEARSMINSCRQVVQASPIRRVGWVFAIIGILGAAGLGLAYAEYDKSAGRNSVNGTLEFGTYRGGEYLMAARNARGKRDATIPWLIGSGVVSMVGIGLIFAGGSPVVRKKCGKCAELVMAEAVVCKHCGENFSG